MVRIVNCDNAEVSKLKMTCLVLGFLAGEPSLTPGPPTCAAAVQTLWHLRRRYLSPPRTTPSSGCYPLNKQVASVDKARVTRRRANSRKIVGQIRCSQSVDGLVTNAESSLVLRAEGPDRPFPQQGVVVRWCAARHIHCACASSARTLFRATSPSAHLQCLALTSRARLV